MGRSWTSRLLYCYVSTWDNYHPTSLGSADSWCPESAPGHDLSSDSADSCGNSEYSRLRTLEMDVQLPKSAQSTTSWSKVTGWFTYRNAPQWLGGTDLTLPSVAIMEVWWGLGYHSVFFLAGLAAIPKDLPEAARIDGATEWQVFLHVILPRLQPIMLILVILRFGTSMGVIDEYLIFGGFNRESPTYTWTIFMYDQAFKIGLWRQGLAAAIGMVGSLVMMAFVSWLIYIFRSRD